MTVRKMILNVNLQGFGQRPSSWRTQEVEGTELVTRDFWENLGRIAERGKLDAVFFADHPALPNPNLRPLGMVEPFVALEAMAGVTEHLGLVGSASTTYNDPYDLAERLLSLDVITGGRLAWNAVTTYAKGVSRNFGITSNPPRPTRYRRAQEFAGIVRKLWQSAASDESVVHHGEFFSVEGKLDVPPSAQGHPVIFQAGGSPAGRDLASSVADAVFSVELLLDPAIENYRAVKENARRHGRRPDDVKIIPGLSFVLGSTEEEANRRYDEMEALAPDNYTLNTLADYLGDEIKDADLNAPVPDSILDREVDENTFHRSLSYQKGIVRWVRKNNTSLRDVLRNFGGYGARIIVGTPEQTADTIEHWYRSGAADGFNLMVDEFPRGLETFVDEVVPILQKREIFRQDYAEKTLRDRVRNHGHIYSASVSNTDDNSENSLLAPLSDDLGIEAFKPPREPGYDRGFGTAQIHAGQHPDGVHGARINPIYLTAGFVFDNFEHARQRFAGEVDGYVYTRLNNPTTTAVEQKLAILENGQNAILVSSGQAATFIATAGILQAGDHVLTAPSIYEGSRSIFRVNYKRFGIDVEFIKNPNNLDEWRRKARPNTKLFFGEAIPNPKNDLIDIEGIASVAQDVAVPFVVDSTIATPYQLKPLDYGADIVVHSTSKFLAGQGAALGGAVIDVGRFDFAAYPDKYPQLSTPINGTDGPSFNDEFGPRAYHFAIKTQMAARFGPTISPFNAFLLQQGLETLSVRMERHASNALAIAHWLEQRPEVSSVDYSGLASNRYYLLAQKYLPHGQGSVFAFTLKGGQPAAAKIYDTVNLITRMTHIGDVRTMILHPQTTTHAKLRQRDRDDGGISEGLLRISVGLEDPQDLITDLEQAFNSL